MVFIFKKFIYFLLFFLITIKLISLIKDYQKNIWYSINDTRVSELSKEFITKELSSSIYSYALFYDKI